MKRLSNIVIALAVISLNNSGCVVIGGIAAIGWAAESIDKAHKVKQARLAALARAAEEHSQRNRIAAAKRKELDRQSRIKEQWTLALRRAAAKKMRVERVEEQRIAKAKLRKKQDQAEKKRVAKAKTKRKEQDRQARARQEQRDQQEKARRREGNIIQKVRDNMTLMKRDITYRGVNTSRLKEFTDYQSNLGGTNKWEVPDGIAQEYFVVHGLYAWHIYLRTGDASWKEITEKCFQIAKQLGTFDAFSVCPEGWTVDTRIMWEDQ